MTKIVKRKTRKKPVFKIKSNAWHLGLAYTLGRTVKKVSNKRGKTGKSSGKPQEPFPPILREIKALADVSGLTAAVKEMNEISLKHSTHPLVNRLVGKLQRLPPAQQEMLSRQFIERVREKLYSCSALYAFPAQAKLTEEDCQKMANTFIECLLQTLEDAGMTPQEKEFLQKFSDDVTRPLNELMRFYLRPKTFSRKVKRLWRMQRIIIKLVKLVNMSQALAKKKAGTVDLAPAIGPETPVNVWLNENTRPIVIKESDLAVK